MLTDAFGNPKILWIERYNTTREKLIKWRDKYSDKDLVGVNYAIDGIQILQEFLREADIMSRADEGVATQFENEYDTLCGLCPITWTRKLLRVEGTHAEKLKKLYELLAGEHALLTKLKINYQKEAALGGKSKPNPKPEDQGEGKKNSWVMMAKNETCWSCNAPTEGEDHSLVKEIGMAGCREFLLKKVYDRMKVIKEDNVCRRCMKHKFVKGKYICFGRGQKRAEVFTSLSSQRSTSGHRKLLSR